ncbi:DNA adenine methylase [Sphingobacterium spiritivorum]
MEIKPARPILRYHGGKWVLAKWIISHFPEHRIYVESFGGAASVLLQKDRCYSEVYNDLDDDIVNLFYVVRDQGEELRDKLINTPFSRREFELSYQLSENSLERARRTVVRAFMGFGSAAASGYKTGFRSNSNRSGTTAAHDWKNYSSVIDRIINRLQGVVIENKDAISLMKQHDEKDCLHYVDPPYMLDTRSKGQKTKSYKYELENFEHENLLSELIKLKGSIVLSGYENEIYNDMLTGWHKSVKKSFADGAAERTEVLWMNFKPYNQLQLF